MFPINLILLTFIKLLFTNLEIIMHPLIKKSIFTFFIISMNVYTSPTFKDNMMVNKKAKNNNIKISFHREALRKKLVSTSFAFIIITKKLGERIKRVLDEKQQPILQ